MKLHGWFFSPVMVLVLSFSGTGQALAQSGTVRYDITVANTWSEATHPGVFPANVGPHFSIMAFLAHSEQYTLWAPGQLASPAVKQMAETGDLIKYQADAQAAISAGDASWSWWNFLTNPSTSWTVTLLDMDDTHPLLSIMSMIGPSPDWFVGVSGLDLRENGIWRNKVVVDIFTYDAGTRSAEAFELFGPLENPPKPISLLDNVLLPGNIPLGSFTFELATPFLEGDMDHDGFVGIEDLNFVLGNWNQTVPAGNQVRGDITGDGFVGIEDLNLILGNWNAGTPPPPEALSNVPEPATAALLGFGVFMISRRRLTYPGKSVRVSARLASQGPD